jgi:hypothetical protein
MTFRDIGIRDLLKTHTPDGADECSEPTSDVVFAMFLEPRPDYDPRWTTAECAIDKAVRMFQPAPAMSHVELLIPPIPSDEGMRTQFATYLGHTSAWQTDKQDGQSYYLVENGGRWRAVPVFCNNAASRLRNECDAELGVKYSLARYLTAVAPFRWLASAMPDKRRSPAHCATITARVLRNSGVCEPKHTSAWYGPTTLYHELCGQAAWRGASMESAPGSQSMPEGVSANVETLLRAPMGSEAIDGIGDQGCMEAVRALTLKACHALTSTDTAAQRMTQQQLASALLRWVLFRQGERAPPPQTDEDPLGDPSGGPLGGPLGDPLMERL